MPALLIHYHELALKGKNRQFFEDRLIREIQKFMSRFNDVKARKLTGRFLIEGQESEPQEWQKVLSRLPGIANTQVVDKFPCDIKTLCEVIPSMIPKGNGSFAIRARRDGKHYPFTSSDLGREVGAAIQKVCDRQVDLNHPELEIVIEVASNNAYVGIAPKVDAYRGLPVGVSGKSVAMLSGGFDSPVAMHLMQCRGLEIHPIHFHSAPMVSRASIDKVKELCEVLSQSQSKMKVCLIPIVDFQKEVVAKSPDPLRIILYRRFMIRLAEFWARRIKAKSLINGDSLGQVASQTIENITAISAVAFRPILRPLVGLSKESIIKIASKIGTEEISKLPHDDCCGFLMPQRPAIKAKIEEVEEAEKLLDLDTLLRETFNKKEVLIYECGKLQKQ